MEKYTLEVTVAIENFETVMAFIERHTENVDNPKVARQMMLVVEELATNVFKYAYDGRQGKFTFSISNDPKRRRIVMEFRDNGKEFNPLQRNDPDTNEPISSREPGGLGIMMSKKLTDEQYYIRDNGENVLTVVKDY